AVLEQRERERADRGEGMARSQFGHPAYSRPYAMRIDMSTCTPEEGAQRIRTYIDEHGG
ncbi:phosphotransferase-like protein, partial [Burkholderia territorii]